MKKKERISSFAHYCWRWLHSRYFIEWLRHIFIAPFGRLRKPADVEWEKSYNGKYYPVCPHCKNMPYDEGSCYFCGQRFSNLVTSVYVPIGSETFTTEFSDNADSQRATIERTEEGTVQSTAAKLAKIAFDAGFCSARLEESSHGLAGGADNMSIGKRIQILRKRCGYTQMELAEKAGVPAVTLQQYEREVRKQPRTEQLEKIASALGTTVAYLLGYSCQLEERHGSCETEEASWQWFEEWDPGNTMHYAECADAGWRCSHCNVNLAEYLQEALPGESIYLDDPGKRPLLNHCPNCGAPIRKENDHAE